MSQKNSLLTRLHIQGIETDSPVFGDFHSHARPGRFPETSHRLVSFLEGHGELARHLDGDDKLLLDHAPFLSLTLLTFQ